MGKLDRLSIYISMILRHRPQEAHITLDEHGWADVEELLAGVAGTGREIDRDMLEEIVATDKKMRYSFNQDKTLIRANQGHSIPVDVELKEQEHKENLKELQGDYSQITWGSQIRSYVLQPYTMVKDLRTGEETGNVSNVLDGGLDAFISAYLKWLSLGCPDRKAAAED